MDSRKHPQYLELSCHAAASLHRHVLLEHLAHASDFLPVDLDLLKLLQRTYHCPFRLSRALGPARQSPLPRTASAPSSEADGMADPPTETWGCSRISLPHLSLHPKTCVSVWFPALLPPEPCIWPAWKLPC